MIRIRISVCLKESDQGFVVRSRGYGVVYECGKGNLDAYGIG
uniref:Uncharacterized protein n=1 Tax=Fagus sylvatica TaxID=28930 RepID=A0A2N9EPE8_FAGSY